MTTRTATRSAIYAPAGKAGEYAGLALNHLSGCEHNCWYCYVPAVIHRPRAQFRAPAQPRLSIEEVERSAARYKGDPRPVLLSFTSDPLQASQVGFTAQVIEALHRHKLRVCLLTKASLDVAAPVIEHLHRGDALAVSLTYLSTEKTAIYEPGAGRPVMRIALLSAAQRHGIETWVSLEPIVEPLPALLELIELSASFAGHYKIGCLNHQTDLGGHDWAAELPEVEARLRALGKPYYVKASLAAKVGRSEGWWWQP